MRIITNFQLCPLLFDVIFEFIIFCSQRILRTRTSSGGQVSSTCHSLERWSCSSIPREEPSIRHSTIRGTNIVNYQLDISMKHRVNDEVSIRWRLLTVELFVGDSSISRRSWFCCCKSAITETSCLFSKEIQSCSVVSSKRSPELVASILRLRVLMALSESDVALANFWLSERLNWMVQYYENKQKCHF